jgi:ABC-type antimicrobial peptide transport system permease subunit
MALGLRPGRLGRLVLLESAFMGAMGAVAGIVLGGLITLYFSINGLTYPGLEEMAAQFNLPGRMYPAVTVPSLVLGPLVVFLFTLIATIYPALRLNALRPVEAMRAV